MVKVTQLNEPCNVRLTVPGIKMGDLILILKDSQSVVTIDFMFDDRVESSIIDAYDMREYNDSNVLVLNDVAYSMEQSVYVAVISTLVEYMTEVC